MAMGSSHAVRARLDRWQRRHASIAFAVAVARKFADDRASGLAALIAYYAFFSMFPLMLVFVSVLGFVLQGDPSLREDVVDSTLARIPVLGAQIGDDVEPLTGSGFALAVGLLGALWSGLGVTVALGRALDAIWDVPRLAQRTGLAARSRGVAVLAVLGVGLVGATVLTHVATGLAHRSAGQDVAAGLVSLLLNGAAFLIVFGLLTDRRLRPREVLPGVALAAVGALVLQAAGNWYVELTVSNASATYGTFALVIGLLSWFWLGAHLVLIAAEVNVVRHRRLWPRALDGTLTRADRTVLSSAAQATRGDRREEIDVRFVDRDG
jgi:membrane protein